MELPRQIFVPQGRHSWRVPTVGDGFPLRYLGWGRREYGENPVPLGKTLGYVYYVALEGNPRAVLEGGTVECSPGSILILDTDCAFGWTGIEGSLSKVLVWTWSDGPHLDVLAPDPGGYRLWKVSPGRLDPLEDLLKECRHELAISDAFSAASLERCHRQLDVTIARLVETPRNKSEQGRYGLAVEWMKHNLSNPQPISSLCDYLQVSEPTLQRIFARDAGCSPLRVFQGLKAERSRELLKEGMAVKEVAFLLGYRHANDFSRFYRKHFGESPSGSCR